MFRKKIMVLRVISSLAFLTWDFVQSQDSRRPPVFSQLFYDASISEAASIDTAVVAPKAFDSNGGRVSYSVVEAGRVPFVINPNTGMITVDGKLDRERQSRYSFRVRATNGDSISSTASVDILIEDVNDKVPEFVDLPYIFTVKENDRVGYVGRVKAVDGDQGLNGIITYSVASNDLIQIDPVSGELLTTRSLDYENEQKIILEVIATDNGLPPLFSTALVTIIVEDKADVLPIFVQLKYEADVPENEANYPIVTVEALSPDPNVPPAYILRQGAADKFSVDPMTGTIRTRQGLDFERERQHILVVGTRENEDTSNPGATTTVVIDVVDRNDNAPSFLNVPRPIRIPTSVPVGHVVTTLTALDGDSFSPANVVRYEIIGSDPSREVFSIDETRGVIQTKTELSKRTETEYVVEVRAYDLGIPQLSSLASVVVIVDRIATVSPEAGVGFAETIHAASVSEDAEATTLIRTLVVSNKPSADTQISCEVVEGNQEGLFYAKPNLDGNCEVRLTRPALDHEAKNIYTITVRLSTPFGLVGRGRTTARVDITVIDVNDNAPVFLFPLPEGKYTFGKYWCAVQPNWRAGANILKLSARDEDSGKLGEIEYYLDESSFFSKLFTLERTTGILRLRQSIGNTSIDALPFKLSAFARDNPGMSMGYRESNVTVYVGILQPHQEILMVIRGSRKERVAEDKDRILEILQTRLGLPVRIASIADHRTVNGSGVIVTEPQSTDLVFYCVEPEFDRILPREHPQIINGLMSDTARAQISSYLSTYLSLDLEEIRGPIDLNGRDFGHTVSASIIDWNGIPIALIAFAALVSVVGVVASIYVCTIWSSRGQSGKWRASWIVEHTAHHFPSVVKGQSIHGQLFQFFNLSEPSYGTEKDNMYKNRREERPPPVYFVPTFAGVSSSSEFNAKPYEVQVMEMSVTSDDSDRSDELRPGLMPHKQFVTRTTSSSNGAKRPPSTLSETVTARTSSMPRYQSNSYSKSIYNHSIEQRDNNYSIIESPIPTSNPLFLEPSEVEDLSHRTSPSNGNVHFKDKTVLTSIDYDDYGESKTVL